MNSKVVLFDGPVGDRVSFCLIQPWPCSWTDIPQRSYKELSFGFFIKSITSSLNLCYITSSIFIASSFLGHFFLSHSSLYSSNQIHPYAEIKLPESSTKGNQNPIAYHSTVKPHFQLIVETMIVKYKAAPLTFSTVVIYY